MDAGFPVAQAWDQQLAGWGVPQEILDQAPRSPWIMPMALFRVPESAGPADSPSHRRTVAPGRHCRLGAACSTSAAGVAGRRSA